MPTNVTPQYREAEERFRAAETTQAKIVALQEMLSIMPKHKGTDHLKARLRSRLSQLTAELEGPSKGPSGGRTEPFSLAQGGRRPGDARRAHERREVAVTGKGHRGADACRRVRAQHSGAGAWDASS